MLALRVNEEGNLEIASQTKPSYSTVGITRDTSKSTAPKSQPCEIRSRRIHTATALGLGLHVDSSNLLCP